MEEDDNTEKMGQWQEVVLNQLRRKNTKNGMAVKRKEHVNHEIVKMKKEKGLKNQK